MLRAVGPNGYSGDTHSLLRCVVASSLYEITRRWVHRGVSVIQGISVGKGALIGAGAAIIADIPNNATGIGVPTKVSKRPWRDKFLLAYAC